MKVLLIQPPLIHAKWHTTTPPISLGYLASSVEKNNDVKIIDGTINHLSLRRIKKKIKNYDPDVVGVTSMTRFIYSALDLIKFAKQNNPNCLTVIGGPHATVRSKETINESSFLDVAVRGEGETTFNELLKNPNNFEKIRGITYRNNGKIIENPNRDLIKDLDSIPFPAYHLLPMDKYKIKFFRSGVYGKRGQPYGVIFTSRGCPYNCIFCSSKWILGKGWRARSPQNVIDELKLLRNKYGMEVIHFWDDTFTLDKKRAIKICDLINKEKIDISWICETRVDQFNEEIAKAIKNAGCKLVYFGLESGVQKTLDYLKKGFKLEDAEKAVKLAKNAGLSVSGFFMLGIPGETEKDIYETINFASKLDLETAEFNLLMPLPGTEIFNMAEKNNLLLTKNWSKYEPGNSIMNVPGFTQKELKKLKKRAYYKFNLS